uniref:Uncharacterized protein n=1 Tax=Ditylenchus dipsaci TaxID=166011 RepID=A0A915EPB7_9BILA
MDLIANYESGTESDQDEVKTPSKLKAYTTKSKIKIIKHAKDSSSNAASKRFGVDRSSVIGDSSPAGKFKKRLRGGGRPLTYKDLDGQIARGYSG